MAALSAYSKYQTLAGRARLGQLAAQRADQLDLQRVAGRRGVVVADGPDVARDMGAELAGGQARGGAAGRRTVGDGVGRRGGRRIPDRGGRGPSAVRSAVPVRSGRTSTPDHDEGDHQQPATAAMIQARFRLRSGGGAKYDRGRDRAVRRPGRRGGLAVRSGLRERRRLPERRRLTGGQRREPRPRSRAAAASRRAASVLAGSSWVTRSAPPTASSPPAGGLGLTRPASYSSARCRRRRPRPVGLGPADQPVRVGLRRIQPGQLLTGGDHGAH